MEDIILKIQKLLALSKSTNENEAHSAMLKAQRLLIKHKLSQQDVEGYLNEKVKVEDFQTEQRFRGKSWKNNLSKVISENFGCYVYLDNGYYGVRTICFYGKEEDVTICNIMLSYAIKCINAEGIKLLKKMKSDKRRKYFDGIKSDYALGFISGLEERFRSQIKKNEEWGLVLQKDQVVIDSYSEFSKGFGTISVSEKFNRHQEVYKKGLEDGRKFDISDKIENEGEEEKLIAL